MISTHGTQSYREADIRSMPRERLVVLLYEKMMRDLDQAVEAHETGDQSITVDRVSHSLQILTELLQALDPGHDEALAGNLASLYEYLIHRHRTYLADRNPAALSDCRRVLTPLMEAWREAALAAEGPVKNATRSDESSSRLFSVSA
jgi:flagellar protein FliS